MTNFEEALTIRIRGGASIIWVYLRGDQSRATRDIKDIVSKYSNEEVEKGHEHVEIYAWDTAMQSTWGDRLQFSDPFDAVRDMYSTICGDAVVLMKDLSAFINSAGPQGLRLRRLLMELSDMKTAGEQAYTKTIITFSLDPTPHPEIAEYCDVIDYELPDMEALRRDTVEYIVSSVCNNPNNTVEIKREDISEELLQQISRSLMGLSSAEATRLLSYAIAQTKAISESLLEIISDEKAKVLRRVDGLRYIPHEKIPEISTVGGFSELIPWLRKRARAYTEHAKLVGMESPRGATLIGPPGCGKTYVAKAAAKVLGLDLVMLDLGALFDKHVGGSEAKIRSALQTVEAMPNVLLLVDECDKALAGAHKSQASDSGVASRMLSYFLTWLSERDTSSKSDNRIFVLMTMNRTTGVDPALFRSGRFDRMWSVDLPDHDARKEILGIHLAKRGIRPSVYGRDLDKVVTATAGFTGAELEELVVGARAEAYHARMSAWEDNGSVGEKPDAAAVQPMIDELLSSAKEITPIAKLDKEDLQNIRKFMQTSGAYPVNGRDKDSDMETRKPRRICTNP